MIAWLVACRGASDPADPPGPGPTDPAPVCETMLSWENFAKPVFDTWCNACHGSAVPVERRLGAPPEVALDLVEVARAFGDRIADRTYGTTGGMPPSGPLPADDLERLEEWLSCGMPGEGDSAPAACVDPAWMPGDAASSGAPCAGGGPVAIAGTFTADVDADLSCLCEVAGDLVVTSAPRLAATELARVGGSLSTSGAALGEVALPRLASVGGDVRIEGQPLAALPLDHLATVGGSLVVAGNPSLAALDLARLVVVGGDLSITDDPALADVGNLTGVVTIGGDVTISDVPAWVGDVEAGWESLLRVASVGGDITIARTGFVEIWAFQELASLPGAITIAGNPDLALISGFHELRTVGGPLELSGNPRLVSFDDAPLMASVGGLVLRDVPALDELARMPDLATSGSLVAIRTGLRDLDSLSLVSVTGDVVIEENANLTSIDALATVTTVGGDVIVRDNPVLSQVEAEAVVGEIDEVTGSTVVSGNQ